MSWLLWRDLIVNLRTPIASKILVGQILVNNNYFKLIVFFYHSKNYKSSKIFSRLSQYLLA